MQCMLQFIIQIRSNEFAFVQQIMPSCVFWVCFFPALVCFIGAAVSGPWCHVWEEGETSGTCDWSRGWWRQLLCYWVVSSCAFEKWSMFLFSFLEIAGNTYSKIVSEGNMLFAIVASSFCLSMFPIRFPLTFGSFAKGNQMWQRWTSSWCVHHLTELPFSAFFP